ncbi:MAG: FHA domain-containing protein [Chloroflexales bacterium]|nr:FHA domain-containing protein [Chloroflexales bacterium]
MARTKPGFITYFSGGNDRLRFELSGDVAMIGRLDTNDVAIPVPIVSRTHARIELRRGRYVLFDANSANGTFANGERVEHEHELSTGDEIWLGMPDVTLYFTDPEQTLMVQLPHTQAPITIDEQLRSVHVYGVSAQLSPLEYRLLVYLAQNQGLVCTREACFAAVWDAPYDHATCEHALNSCVSRLRGHLREAAESSGHEPPAIATLPRVGFRLNTQATFATTPQPARTKPATALLQLER